MPLLTKGDKFKHVEKNTRVYLYWIFEPAFYVEWQGQF